MILSCRKKQKFLSFRGISSISSVRLKFLDRRRSTRGEDNLLAKTDVKGLKHRERLGLETPVVYALTDESETLKNFQC